MAYSRTVICYEHPMAQSGTGCQLNQGGEKLGDETGVSEQKGVM